MLFQALYTSSHRLFFDLKTFFALRINYRRGKITEKINYPVPSEVEKQITDRVDQLGRKFLTRP